MRKELPWDEDYLRDLAAGVLKEKILPYLEHPKIVEDNLFKEFLSIILTQNDEIRKILTFDGMPVLSNFPFDSTNQYSRCCD